MKTINVTKPEFNFDNVPKNWFHDDEFMTNFMISLSVAFPAGERFFVDSVRVFRELATSQEQKQNISGFCGQEAIHSLHHANLHKVLDKYGPAKELEDFVYKLLSIAKQTLPKRHQLAVTVGLEHFTAILAKQLLETNTIESNMDKTMWPLWRWHSQEEIQHKSVAFDLYKLAKGNYIERTSIMIISTFVLFLVLHAFQIRLGLADKSIWKVSKVVNGLIKLYGINGYITKIIPDYLKYFKPSFHPNDIQDGHLI